MTTFAGESTGTVARKVVNQIGAVGAQKTRLLSAIVNVHLAVQSLPASGALALVPALSEGNASRVILAWVSIGGARVDRDVTINSRVATAAETGVVLVSRFVLAHGTSGAGVALAIGLLLLTIHARVSQGTLAPVALRQVRARSTVITGRRSALINVDLTATAREASGTEALHIVSNGNAESSVLTGVLLAGDRFAFLTSSSASVVSLHVCGALHARVHSWGVLEEVQWARRAGSESGGRVHSRWALVAAMALSRG